MKEPSVAVIILNFNGLEDTDKCISSVLRTNYGNFCLFIVDNGSYVDETKELKKRHKDKRICFIRFGKNLGFAKGNNEILRTIKTKYAVLLNNDTIVEENWLKELAKTIESSRDIVACQPKIKSLKNPEFFEYAGAAGGYLDKLGYPYARGRVGFDLEKDNGQYDQQVDIFWGSGTCLFLRRSVLDFVGFLPENFFFYHEETDLCWRIKNAGFRIVFVPSAIVFHKGGATSSKNMLRRIFYIHRNNLLLLSRNLTLSSLLWKLPLRIILDLFSGVFYLLGGKFLFIFPLLLAEISFLLLLPGTIAERAKYPFSRLKAEKLLSPFSIYWNYFILRHRTFSSLNGRVSDKKSQTVYYNGLIDSANLAKNIKRVKSLFVKKQV